MRRCCRGGALALTLAVAAGAASGCELGTCLAVVSCCASCEGPVTRRAVCACEDGEKEAHLCAARSTCALDYYVADGPAVCCQACDASELREEPGPRCDDDERYLHECPIESACFQGYRAEQLGTRFLPFSEATTGVGGPLTAIWVDPAGEAAWAVGWMGRLIERQGEGWRSVPSATTESLTAIFGLSAEDIRAVGLNGTALRYDGQEWRLEPTPTDEHLYGLWGSASDAVWAVGARGTILRDTGEGWVAVESPTDAHLASVSGAGAGELYAVGQGGTIVHRRASSSGAPSWVVEPSPAEADLTGVHVTDLSRVYAVGLAGTVLSRSAGGWERLEVGILQHLFFVAGAATELWAVGGSGLIMNFDGKSWSPISYFSTVPPGDLLGLYVGASGVWITGESGAVLHLSTGATDPAR